MCDTKLDRRLTALARRVTKLEQDLHTNDDSGLVKRVKLLERDLEELRAAKNTTEGINA